MEFLVWQKRCIQYFEQKNSEFKIHSIKTLFYMHNYAYMYSCIFCSFLLILLQLHNFVVLDKSHKLNHQNP